MAHHHGHGEDQKGYYHHATHHHCQRAAQEVSVQRTTFWIILFSAELDAAQHLCSSQGGDAIIEYGQDAQAVVCSWHQVFQQETITGWRQNSETK